MRAGRINISYATPLLLAGLLALGGCKGSGKPLLGADGRRHYARYSAAGEVTDARGRVDIYAFTGPSDLMPVARRARPLVYVPNSRSASVSVIDPATYRVIRTFRTGAVPQHVVPSYDLARLWVLDNGASTVIPIDPLTGQPGKPVRVSDP